MIHHVIIYLWLFAENQVCCGRGDMIDAEKCKPKKKIHVNTGSVSVIELLGRHINLLKYHSRATEGRYGK